MDKENKNKAVDEQLGAKFQKNDIEDFLSDLVDDVTDLKPLSTGLGFRDRVSQDEEVSVHSAYAGTLDLGIQEPGDGQVSITPGGDIAVESPHYPQPFLRHSGHDGLVKSTPKKTKGSLVASAIDLLTLISVFMFVIAFLTAFSDLELSFSKLLNRSRYVFLNYMILFSALYMAYTIMLRSLFGRTLGEWACRIQLGLKSDQLETNYPIKVMVREIAYLVTGVLTLPVISYFTGKDIGFYISGLQNYLEEK